MGYYTQFVLRGCNPSSSTNEIRSALQGLTTDSNYLDGSGDSLKWYSHVQDCEKVSALFPMAAFRISGDGEESGDVWWKEYLGGCLVNKWKQEVSPLAGISTETLKLQKQKQK
jgi:hypothetical protein